MNQYIRVHIKTTAPKAQRYVKADDGNLVPVAAGAGNVPDYVYLPVESYPSYIEYLEKHLAGSLSESDEESQSAMVCSVAENIMEHRMFSSDGLKGLAPIISKVLARLPSQGIDHFLVALAQHSYQSLEHALRTSVMSIGFAQYLKLAENQLISIGIGAILHDIGETMISPAILNSPDALTPNEREEYRLHPAYGLNALDKRNIADPIVRSIMSQHHECWDGSGYPHGLRGSQISRFARLVSIVDEYVSITSKHHHKDLNSGFDALKQIILSREFNMFEIQYFAAFLAEANIRLQQ